ncbi:Gfo/Idh/MocA family oxidoreductase [Telmatocola sphagniphila]|uniref:Gfo/Idh/MocA family oxidoreductase n=2 Tax=Telmatocola sphagniphila TaxID=1123043 RepID=A0A8E6EX96_9BACT|nr:Gfo/Idh/MocA family oxidoreductase [Telmatocola sphagniphila]
MVGLGMIFDETYRPFFESCHEAPIFDRRVGSVDLRLVSVATRTGTRADQLMKCWSAASRPVFESFAGSDSVDRLLASDVHAVCIATPDDRHFEPARKALQAGKHVLIEKPAVLNLSELDELVELAGKRQVLCKIVYHKLLDPDHKKLRTLYRDGVLQHVNNGYCSLLEPKSISTGQFAEWISGRNPASYVAVHYLKLIDFTFGPDWRLKRIHATGQRGIVGSSNGSTWDSVQLQVTYEYPDAREATFDIHTSWVTPDNFPGYVDQEVQFRFDNSIWLAHQRKRGVELAIEGRTPQDFKNTPNYHYNGSFLEPWGERCQRGYGIEVISRFFQEVGYVEFGTRAQRTDRLAEMRSLTYNDVSADRNCVAIVQALEALLTRLASGDAGSWVEVNGSLGGLVLFSRNRSPEVLYSPAV